jgi:hypothetical protein
MAQERLRLLLGALAACLSLAAYPAGKDLKTPQTPWSRLTVEERTVLVPLEPDWEKLPGYQQQRLMSAARKYPTMRPIQQERFQERIRDWAAMTPEQRKAAREKFQGLRKLPPSKQHELRQRWLEREATPGPSPVPDAGPVESP